jgi:CheY-like chemotaxis protein
MRILIADDDPDILRLIKVNLDYLGHTVLETSDGEHAIQVAAQERPDLIVLDVKMPYRDGLSILRELTLLPETMDLPVILLTASAMADEQQEGWASGAAEYLVKPFTPYDLANAIDKVKAMSLEDRQAHRASNLALLDRFLGLSHPVLPTSGGGPDQPANGQPGEGRGPASPARPSRKRRRSIPKKRRRS